MQRQVDLGDTLQHRLALPPRLGVVGEVRQVLYRVHSPRAHLTVLGVLPVGLHAELHRSLGAFAARVGRLHDSIICGVLKRRQAPLQHTTM